MRWDDVNARARGLATHLLNEQELHRVADAHSWDELVRALRDAGYPLGSAAPAGLEQLDTLVGEVTARRYALLGRWLDHRRSVLALVYEVEERDALRALLRGAVQGVSAARRIQGLTPTPELPRAALEDLAQAASPADLARLLLRHGHPAGRALDAAVTDPHPPGLLGLEMALARTFAARATRAARRGGRILRAFAAWIVDLENAWALLQAPEWGPDVEAADLFLPGGRALPMERFSELSRAGVVDAIHEGLANAFAGSPFRRLFVAESAGENRFERRALGAQIDWCRAMARLQPLGPPVVLGVLLRIRAEATDIRAAAWSAALLAPAGASWGGG